MISHHASQGFVWLDVSLPTNEEILGLKKRYDLHPLVAQELNTSSAVAKADSFKDHMLLVLPLPVRKQKNGSHQTVVQTVKLVLGKNFLITVRTEAIEQLDYFAKIFETNSILKKEEKIEHSGHLFYYMIKRIYSGMYDDLENIKDALKKFEEEFSVNTNLASVMMFNQLGLELIGFKHASWLHNEIWDRMVDSGISSLFSKEFGMYILDLQDEFVRNREHIANARETYIHMQQSLNSVLSVRQSGIQQNVFLTGLVLSALILISFLSSVFPESMRSWTIAGAGVILLAMGAYGYYIRKKGTHFPSKTLWK